MGETLRAEDDAEVPSLLMIDPHVHYWSPGTHTWLQGALKADAPGPLKRFESVAKDFWPGDHAEFFTGNPNFRLAGSVYVQANMHVDRTAVEEAALCEGLARGSGHLGLGSGRGLPTAFAVYAPLDRPVEAATVLESLRRYSGFRGVRFMLDFHPDRPELCQTDRGDYMCDENFLKGVGLLDPDREVFELQLCQIQLLEAASFVARFPRLTFVLNHAGFPLRGGFDQWRDGMLALAAAPNVCVKIGGLGCYDRPHWSQEEVDKYVQTTIDIFSPARCMFASNLPVDLIDIPKPTLRYASLYAAVKTRYSPADCRALFYDNANRIYRLGLPSLS